MAPLKQSLKFVAALWLCSAVSVLASDPRQVWDGQTPKWLASVGRLTVPGIRVEDGYPRHHNEDCSATLVRGPDAGDADIIVTAWHCLEYYRDLSRPITFTLLPESGNPVQRSARRLTDGGGMHADWAIMRLDRPVSGDMAVAIVGLERLASGAKLTMAGYSGDPGIGAHGQRLTYHANCRLTADTVNVSRTDCLAFKGASGGAVFRESPGDSVQLIGVVSEGDGETTSTYVPLTRLRAPLDRYLGATAPRP